MCDQFEKGVCADRAKHIPEGQVIGLTPETADALEFVRQQMSLDMGSEVSAAEAAEAAIRFVSRMVASTTSYEPVN